MRVFILKRPCQLGLKKVYFGLRYIVSFIALRILRFSAITLYPYVFVREDVDSYYLKFLLRHEYVHLMQQEKVGLYKFCVLYLWEFLRNWFRYFSFMKAYMDISFEKEARSFENEYYFIERFGRSLEVLDEVEESEKVNV